MAIHDESRLDSRVAPKGAVARTHAILQAVARMGRAPLPLLSDEVQIPATTLAALLTALEREGLVQAVGKRPKQYAMGSALLQLASRTLQHLDVRDASRPLMQALSEDLGCTTHLGVLSDRGDAVIYVGKVTPATYQGGMASYVGATVPLYCTALGKVLVAYAKDSLRSHTIANLVVSPRTPNTVHSTEEFAQAVAQARSVGYAFDLEENETGICCCSAPVFNVLGECVAAVSATLTAARFAELGAESIATRVLNRTKQISASLGFAPMND